MPTIKPRLTLNLSPEVNDLITELAALQGGSKVSVVNDLLEVGLPTLRAVRDALQRIASVKQSELASLEQSLDKAMAVVSPVVGDLFGALERLGRDPSERS